MTALAWIALLGLAVLVAPGPSSAQPLEIPATWGGDFWGRPRLTGDWGGLRDELGKKGVVFDADLILTPQGVLGGGRDTEWEFWGNAEYTLNVDTGKLGAWPGGFLKIVANSSFGDSLLGDAGATLVTNIWSLLPQPDDPASALMNATFLQFLSPQFGVLAGKISLIDSFHGEFTGNFRTQFLNAGLNIPLNLALVPFSAYGGGFIVIPTESLVLSALLVDPSGKTTNNDVSEAFDDGFMVLASGKLTIKPFGLVGHQGLGGMWSDKNRLSLNQNPSNLGRLLLEEEFPLLGDRFPVLRRIIERFFPELLVPVRPANRQNSTWSMYYTFDQYFWQPAGDPKRGIGLFFAFGASDPDTNPIQYIYNVGISGNGVVPGRPHDTFGLGWARIDFSDNFVPVLRQRLDLGLDHEDAIEMYYNVSITGWLNVTLDLQIIEPGLKRAPDSSGRRLKDVDTAVVGGARVYIRF